MEQAPSNKQESYQELTEPSMTAAVEYVDVAPEIDNKKKEKLKKYLKDIGHIALGAAVTYGAIKSGTLDSIPAVANGDEISDAMFATSAGFMGSKTVDLVKTFRKK